MNTNTFKKRLGSTMRDNALERFVSNRKKGKLDFRKIHKISHSTSIFKQKEERKGKDYSVTFLLDASGSMFGGGWGEGEARSEVLLQAMEKLAPVFEELDIPLAIYSFNCLTFLLKDFNQKVGKNGELRKDYNASRRVKYGVCGGYAGGCGNEHILTEQELIDYKQAEKARRQNSYSNRYEWRCDKCGRYSTYISQTEGGTNDALALHIVGNAICKRNKKNILIVITDGDGGLDPNHSFNGIPFSKLVNAETVLRGLHRKYKDLIVLGIGINTGATSRVYGNANTVQIKNATEVFPQVIKLLFKNIKRQ